MRRKPIYMTFDIDSKPNEKGLYQYKWNDHVYNSIRSDVSISTLEYTSIKRVEDYLNENNNLSNLIVTKK